MKQIPYGHQWIEKADIAQVIRILKSDWITQGAEISKFEQALCQYTGARYAIVTCNATAALHLACLAAGIKAKDEVITSPITFVASANSILYCGGKPVFADVRPDTANIDVKDIGRKINSRTKAIMPVHFAGHPCEMQEIAKLARKHKLLVIEDAAHALGAEYKGKKIGSCQYSDMTIFSFHPVKSITTGEGGAVLTNDKKLYEKLLLLRSHGITKDKAQLIKKDEGPWYYEMQVLGFNDRITDFQCALGISQLGKLDKFVKNRREIVSIYNQKLSHLDEIILPSERLQVKSSWHIYCIRLKDHTRRRIIFDTLRKLGIGVQVHYIPVYLQPYYQKLGYKSGACTKAEDFYSRVISLPIYPSMKKEDIKIVIRQVEKAFK